LRYTNHEVPGPPKHSTITLEDRLLFATRHFYGVRAALWAPALLLTFAWQARAVHFTLASAGPPTWTYTLTYDSEDNYTAPATITLSGLTGVTAAGIPTSTDFPAGLLDTGNLNWTVAVSGGGTTVTWTNLGGGTGNFATAKHVFGFTVTAPTAPNGTASFATNGFNTETTTPYSSRDVSGTVAGPSNTVPASVPAVSPTAFLLTLIGLACVGALQSRRHLESWFGRQA